MARPIKKGLSYFPLEVHAFEDPKLESLQYQYGPIGAFVYIRILTLVYQDGYYIKLSSDALAIKIQKLIGAHWIRVDKILDIIRACVELRLFERALFLQGVITSVSIQTQYILSTKRRKSIQIDKYWLLDQVTMEKLGVFLSVQKNRVNVSNNPVNVSKNLVNVNKSTQSKSKSKKDKEIIIDKSIYGKPKMHYLTKLIIQKKYIDEVSCDIFSFNKLFEEVIDIFGYDNVLSAVRYIISHSSEEVNDKYNFMKASLFNNLSSFKNQEKRKGDTFENWIKQRIL